MKKFVVAGAVVLAGLGVFAYLRSGGAPAGETPPPSAAVTTMQLTVQNVPVQIQAFGSIMAGTAEQNIALRAPGVVTEVLVRPGQSVAAGQELAVVAPDPQSIADLRRAQNAVQAAEAARAHVAALLPGHLATAADLAAATQAAADAAANLQALQALDTGAVLNMRAPFAGTITSVTASVGGTSPAGSNLFKLVAPGGLVAVAGLPELQAARISPGDSATITALNSNKLISATVLQRAAMLNPQTGLVDVTLAPGENLPLGEPLALSITAGSITGYPVPRDAVQNDEQGDYVFQVDAKNIAHRETAHVLQAGGPTSVLAPDLDATMPLVTTGAYQLQDGMAAIVQGRKN